MAFGWIVEVFLVNVLINIYEPVRLCEAKKH